MCLHHMSIDKSWFSHFASFKYFIYLYWLSYRFLGRFQSSQEAFHLISLKYSFRFFLCCIIIKKGGIIRFCDYISPKHLRYIIYACWKYSLHLMIHSLHKESETIYDCGYSSNFLLIHLGYILNMKICSICPCHCIQVENTQVSVPCFIS